MAYVTVNSDTLVTSTSGGILGAGNASTMKNRIINGAMVIDQRNAGASITIPSTGSTYSVDRWFFATSQASKLSAQQNGGAITPPVGFANYMGITSLSAYSVTSTDYFDFIQSVEGYNLADLGWGSANAKTVTLSFQVYSSLTGTFGGVISNGSFNYQYPFTYSIPVANTWTTISVTIAGPTSGTWNITNSVGAYVIFGLGAGSTVSGTAGSWATQSIRSATGATSVVGTSGATFYITGVQLEVGTSATGFEYRQYGTEYNLCLRYFEQTFPYGTTLANYTGTNNSPNVRAMYINANGSNPMGWSHDWKVTKRASPTFTVYRASTPYTAGQLDNAGTGITATTSNIGTNSSFVYATGNNMYFNFTVDAEL